MGTKELELVHILFRSPERLAQISSGQVEDRSAALIIKAMEIISSKGMLIHPKTVKDLISTGIDEDIDKKKLHALVDEALATTIEYDPEYLIASFREDYNGSVLFEALNTGMQDMRDHSSEEVVKRLDEALGKMTTATRSTTVRSATEEAFKRIESIVGGTIPPYWKTGHIKTDRTIGWNKAMFIMIAAARKVGKTRWTVDQVMRLMRDNPTLDVFWYSFEMKPSRIINLMIAWMTNLDSTYLDGRDGVILPEHVTDIRKACNLIEGMPIRFLDQKCTVDTMHRDLRRMLKRDSVVVIDNIGLITNPGLQDLQHEDEVAKRMVTIRDELDPLILAIHHLNKEVESKWNRDALYEPSPVHVRGSSRLTDYANLLALLHRPGLYSDLEEIMGKTQFEKLKNTFLVKVSLNRDAEDEKIYMDCDLGQCHFSEQ